MSLSHYIIKRNSFLYQSANFYPRIRYCFVQIFLYLGSQKLYKTLFQGVEYRFCYFWILQRLGCWKMYRNTFQDVLEAEKGAKQKWVLFFETPCRFRILSKSGSQTKHAFFLDILANISGHGAYFLNPIFQKK